MRRTLALVILGATMLAAAPAAEARGFLLGPRLSIDLDDDHAAVGLEARVNLATVGRSVGLQLRPSFDYYFIDHVSLFDLSLDFLFVFAVGSGTVEPYAGAGLSIFIYDSDPGDGGSDAGVDLLGGVKFLPRGAVQPFIELRPTVGGDIDPVLLTFGVLFVI